MKVNILEAHDRLKYLIKDQSKAIFEGAEACLKKNPNSLFYQTRSPYIYIFAHPRTDDEGRGDKRMLWQPRLMKPAPQTNSYLFRALSHTDIIETIWLLPPEELWKQYRDGNIAENADVLCSIDNYLYARKQLGAPHPDDLPEERCRLILKELIDNIRFDKMMKKTYDIKPGSSEGFLMP
jgi:hypothetical protein